MNSSPYTIVALMVLVIGFLTAGPVFPQSSIQTTNKQPGAWFQPFGPCDCPSGFSSQPTVNTQRDCESPDACESLGFFLDDNGYIGLGTTDPRFPVDVYGNINASGGLRISSPEGGGYIMSLGPSQSSSPGRYNLNVSNFDAGAVRFYTGTTVGRPTYRMGIFNTGRVGIGLSSSSTPSYLLHVNGSVGATSYGQISTRDVKTAVEPIVESVEDEMLGRLLAMELTTYEYKAEYGGDGRRHLGFIAEEMPSELQTGDGRSIDLYALMSYTIGALQAQQRQIEELSELRSANSQLKSKIDQLDAELARMRQFVADAPSLHRGDLLP